MTELTPLCRKANEESILAVQIFDQKKFKKKDQGFLGVVNVRVGSVIDLDAGGDGVSSHFCVCLEARLTNPRLQRCSRVTSARATTTSSSMAS